MRAHVTKTSNTRLHNATTSHSIFSFAPYIFLLGVAVCFSLQMKIMAAPVFRCFSKRLLASPSVITSAVRAYGSSQLSLGAQIVAKNAPPPIASRPPPGMVVEVKSPPPQRVSHQPSPPSSIKTYQPKKPKKGLSPEVERPKIVEKKSATLPTSCWVMIHSIPPMSTLDDMVNSLNQVLDSLTGIVDLDAPWKSGGQVPLLDPPNEWIRSARIQLSTHGRPSAWKIEFYNRSIANAFLGYCRTHEFLCAWKPVSVSQWQECQDEDSLKVSDSMIRVENVSAVMTVDHIRHLFRRYDMTREGPSVKVLYEKSQHKMFLVHFADPSWARAAVRELQGVRVGQDFLRLAQYPKQIL